MTIMNRLRYIVQFHWVHLLKFIYCKLYGSKLLHCVHRADKALWANVHMIDKVLRTAESQTDATAEYIEEMKKPESLARLKLEEARDMMGALREEE